MLALLSPAKRLDFESAVPAVLHTQPQLLKDSAELMETTRALSEEQVRGLMKLSPALGKLNHERFAAMGVELTPSNARQAVLAFRGDVYRGLDVDSLSPDDLLYAQGHLGILSGLYGYLRPLDLMQPYRLEMGTRLATPRGKNLYSFWGERITERVVAALTAQEDDTLVNLASREYFSSVQESALPGRMITPVFKDTKAGKSRVLFAFAKPARGMMARFMITERVTHPEGLKAFDLGGYRFREDMSEGDTWVFERPQPPPPKR